MKIMLAAFLAAAGQVGAATAPSPDAFARLDGTWSGDGVADLTNGHSVILKCVGAYSKADATMDLKMACEYGQQKVGLTGNMQEAADGSLTGTFSDNIIHVPGRIAGASNVSAVSMRVSALGMSGRINVTVKTDKMLVNIVPETPGTGVKEVAVVLLKAASDAPSKATKGKRRTKT